MNSSTLIQCQCARRNTENMRTPVVYALILVSECGKVTGIATVRRRASEQLYDVLSK